MMAERMKKKLEEEAGGEEETKQTNQQEESAFATTKVAIQAESAGSPSNSSKDIRNDTNHESQELKDKGGVMGMGMGDDEQTPLMDQ